MLAVVPYPARPVLSALEKLIATRMVWYGDCKYKSERKADARISQCRCLVMEITTPLSDQLSRYMDLAAAQLKATATNMANIDTPGFHTVGFDFEAEMRRALSGEGTPAIPPHRNCRRSTDCLRGPTETTFRWTAKDWPWRRPS